MNRRARRARALVRFRRWYGPPGPLPKLRGPSGWYNARGPYSIQRLYVIHRWGC